jgi:hypothetical protein
MTVPVACTAILAQNRVVQQLATQRPRTFGLWKPHLTVMSEQPMNAYKIDIEHRNLEPAQRVRALPVWQQYRLTSRLRWMRGSTCRASLILAISLQATTVYQFTGNLQFLGLAISCTCKRNYSFWR